jgi:hypothetical protein
MVAEEILTEYEEMLSVKKVANMRLDQKSSLRAS